MRDRNSPAFGNAFQGLPSAEGLGRAPTDRWRRSSGTKPDAGFLRMPSRSAAPSCRKAANADLRLATSGTGALDRRRSDRLRLGRDKTIAMAGPRQPPGRDVATEDSGTGEHGARVELLPSPQLLSERWPLRRVSVHPNLRGRRDRIVGLEASELIG